jgi:hypothetical protein
MQVLYNEQVCYLSNYLYLVTSIDFLMISSSRLLLLALQYSPPTITKPALLAEMESRAIPSSL